MVVSTSAGPRVSESSDILGHASVTTTEVYAKISGKTRRREIEKASANIVKASKYTEQEKSDIVEWLKSIM